MCTIACRSVRHSTFPALDSDTARPTSIVTVPTRGFGILPAGPRIRPRRPTIGIMSGVAMAVSKSSKPSWMRCARSSAPTTSAPASSASRALSPWAKTAMRTSLPRPLGSATVPRSCSSAWRTFSPVRTCTSTDSLNLTVESCLTSPIASAGEYSRSRSKRWRASAYALPCFAISDHLHAHRTRGAGDDLLRGLDVVRVQILHLLLSDRLKLGVGDLRDLVTVRLGGTLVEVQRLLDQDGGRRLLGDERERAVLIDRDHDRDHRAGVSLRLGVERLDELHDVDAVLAERGADRGRGAGLTANRLQLDLGE